MMREPTVATAIDTSAQHVMLITAATEWVDMTVNGISGTAAAMLPQNVRVAVLGTMMARDRMVLAQASIPA